MVGSSGTLGGLVAMELKLNAHCHNDDCRHGATLDINALIARYGENAPVQGPRRIGGGLLVCGRCGNHNCSMRLGLVKETRMSR